MKTRNLLILATVAASLAFEAGVAQAVGPVTPFWDRVAQRQARRTPWHGGYYNTAWGQPVAVVVPPNVELQTEWSWGVTGTEVTPIWHQYRRHYPGGDPGGAQYGFTPPWSYHTDQFGYYYVRGPW